MAAKGLTDKQLRFCELYAQNGGNATQAALDAGFGEKYARQTGHRLLSSKMVQERLFELSMPLRDGHEIRKAAEAVKHIESTMAEAAARMQIAEQRVVEAGTIADIRERQGWWSRVMRGEEPQEFEVEAKLEDGTTQRVTVEVPYDMKERLRASELLGKSQMDFADRVIHEVREVPLRSLSVAELTKMLADHMQLMAAEGLVIEGVEFRREPPGT